MAGRIFAALLIFAAIAAVAGCKHAAPLPPNVSRLIVELRSPDLRPRQDAAVALGKVQPLPPEAIEALTEAVKTEEAVQSAESERRISIIRVTSPERRGSAGDSCANRLGQEPKSPDSCEGDSGIGSRCATRSDRVADFGRRFQRSRSADCCAGVGQTWPTRATPASKVPQR